MLSSKEAEAALALTIPGAKAQDWILYQDRYLFRVKLPNVEEQDFDPFFSVDTLTGYVDEFSVMHDGDISEIARLFAENSKGRR